MRSTSLLSQPNCRPRGERKKKNKREEKEVERERKKREEKNHSIAKTTKSS